MNTTLSHKRMPILWTAHGTSMTFEDHGSCVFFELLHIHLCYLLTLTGDLTFADRAEIASNPRQLSAQGIVKLNIDLETFALRVSSPNFGGLGKTNLAIPYRSLIVGYWAIQSLPVAIFPAESRETACRGAELLINALERHAPGLTKTLWLSGLPANFSFDQWPKNENATIPGQILRMLPQTDLNGVLAWIQSPRFRDVCDRVIADVHFGYDGIEGRN